MKLIIKGKNLRVTKPLKEYAEKKLSKLDDFFENILEATLEVEVEKVKGGDLHKAHLVLKLPKHVILKGETKTKDMYTTIDKLEAKMINILRRQHEKFKDHKAKKQHSRLSTILEKFIPKKELSEEIIITKDNRFRVKPMDPVEAVLQLSKTSLKFYTFHNTKVHHHLSIVYERADGSYGLQTLKDAYLKRVKGKLKSKAKNSSKKTGGIKITKINQINNKKMSVEKAVDSLLSKKKLIFFPFINLETGHTNIVYKSSEKKIKVIEPSIK